MLFGGLAPRAVHGMLAGMDGVQNTSELREGARRTWHRQTGRYTPHRFGRQSWHRFLDDRTKILVRRVGGHPDERQGALIEAMINAEWQALKLEAEAEAAGAPAKERYNALHLAAEFRRQLLLLDRDLTSTTRYKPAPAPSSPPSLTEIIADAKRQRRAAT